MKDLRGIELAVGHIVAFADRKGNVARLRTGEIVDLRPDSNQVEIKWDNSEFGPESSVVSFSGIYVNRPRIAVIDTA